MEKINCPAYLKGREIIVKALLGSLAGNRVGHAYLFSGPEGMGKKTLAHFWSRALNCRGNHPPCLECVTCRKALHNNHPDIMVLKPQGASIKIGQLREMKENLYMAPYEGGRRTVIIEDAQEMTMAAGNSLLKILEEPPSGLVFILLCSKPWAILPTILSRCFVFNLSPLEPATIKEIVEEKYPHEEEKTSLATALSGGNPGQALNYMAREGEGQEKMDYLFSILSLLDSQEEGEFFSRCEELAKRKDLDELLSSLSVIFRDRATWQATGNKDLLLGAFLSKIETAGDYRQTEHKWRILEQTRQKIKENVNTRLALEAMYWQMRGVI